MDDKNAILRRMAKRAASNAEIAKDLLLTESQWFELFSEMSPEDLEDYFMLLKEEAAESLEMEQKTARRKLNNDTWFIRSIESLQI